VKDKPLGLTLFTGGFHKYREHCEAAKQDGYKKAISFVSGHVERAV
jgi:hypothetical protein